MKNFIVKTICTSAIILLVIGCNDSSTGIHEEHSDFAVIEHACLHMADVGVDIEASATMPGPHLDEEDFDHTRLNVALADIEGGKGGYIHFGPNITAEMFVMTSEDVPLVVINRTTSGDTETEIEQTFTAQEIADSTGCTQIKKAIVFDAKNGGNIIRIGPTTFDTISLIIEEGSHGHSH
ncbi:hypothetical protein CHISP_3670 [Chitinispirillum alkaliphilum]|nr:hypothetical protein CHISP_3670 [Chitinispirillum alkaliphilum]